MEASYSPSSPELTLIRKFGPPTDTSNSSSSNSSSSKKMSKSKCKSKGDKSVGMMGHEAGNSSGSGNNTTSGSSEFKSVLGCGGKKDYRRSVVDLTWRRGKVGDKITREYQRF